MLEKYPHDDQTAIEQESEVRTELRELFPEEDPVLTYTATLADLERGQRVLDVGCGDGALTFYEKLKVGNIGYVAGIDIDSEKIEDACDYADYLNLAIDFRLSDLTDLPYEDNYFDVVTFNFVLHHLPIRIKQQGFGETLRVLKPGGHMFIVDYGLGKGIYRMLAPAVVKLLWFLNETKNAGDNVTGRIPEQVRTAGFTDIEIVDNLPMRYLTVDFIRARKPLKGKRNTLAS